VHVTHHYWTGAQWIRKCACLDSFQEHLEKHDPRGRTPLVVAVLKGRVSIVDRLLNKYNADATFAQEREGWNGNP